MLGPATLPLEPRGSSDERPALRQTAALRVPGGGRVHHPKKGTGARAKKGPRREASGGVGSSREGDGPQLSLTRRLPLPPCVRARLRTGRPRTRVRDLRSRSRPRSTRSGVTGESPRARSRRSSNISEGVPWRLSLLAVGCARPDADRPADGEHVDGGEGDARGRAEEPVPENARSPCFSAGGARSLRATERPPQGDLQRGTRKMRCFAHVRLPSPTSTHNLPELER